TVFPISSASSNFFRSLFSAIQRALQTEAAPSKFEIIKRNYATILTNLTQAKPIAVDHSTMQCIFHGHTVFINSPQDSVSLSDKETPAPISPSGAIVMSRIFLCHANEDKAQVREVYQRLKSEGFQPWLDEEDLLPGQLWNQEIRKALKSSDFILIFFSQNSVAKRGYVQREMKLALDTWEEVPEGQIHTIPI